MIKYSYEIDVGGGNQGGWIYRQVGKQEKIPIAYVYNTTELKRTTKLLNKAVQL